MRCPDGSPDRDSRLRTAVFNDHRLECMTHAPLSIEGRGSETSVTERIGNKREEPSALGSLAAIFSFQAQTVGRLSAVVVVGTRWLRLRDTVNTFYECVVGCRGDDRPDGERELPVKMSTERDRPFGQVSTGPCGICKARLHSVERLRKLPSLSKVGDP